MILKKENIRTKLEIERNFLNLIGVLYKTKHHT